MADLLGRKQLRAAIRRRGWTLEQAAAKQECTRDAMRAWCNGSEVPAAGPDREWMATWSRGEVQVAAWEQVVVDKPKRQVPEWGQEIVQPGPLAAEEPLPPCGTPARSPQEPDSGAIVPPPPPLPPLRPVGPPEPPPVPAAEPRIDPMRRAREALEAVVTHDRRDERSRRPRPVRAATLSTRVTNREVVLLRKLNEDYDGSERPRDRTECVEGMRPCPFVSCRYHLFLDVGENGSIKLNFPDLEPDEIPMTCALDVADAGGATLEQIGSLMNVTRERARQLEEKAQAKMRVTDARRRNVLRELHDDGRQSSIVVESDEAYNW